MIIDSKSLCSTCTHAVDCSLITNKDAVWSCSEYKDSRLEDNKPESILSTDFSLTDSRYI